MLRNKLSHEYELILLCAQLRINDAVKLSIKEILNNSVDWNKLVTMSFRQEISPLLFKNLTEFNAQHLIPHNIWEILKNSYYVNFKRNLLIEEEISCILKLTNQKGFAIIALKGLALIQNLYHDPGLRILADIDLLVKDNEIQAIIEIFSSLGYKNINKDLSKQKSPRYQEIKLFLRISSLKQSLLVELHRFLAAPRPYNINIPYLWERTHEQTIHNQKIKLLSNEDTFLLLALHLRQHIRQPSLKFTIDIAELINKTGRVLDWPYIINIAKSSHIKVTVYFAFYIIGELHKISIAKKISDEFCPNIIKSSLIGTIINKKNFFCFDKFRGTLLRILLFDSLSDFILYLWRVSFLERFAERIGTKAKKYLEKN